MADLKKIEVVRKLLQANTLEPYIRHIRFPFYKNLVPFTRVDFDFPITALVGANGTNKSSILRAIQGAPEDMNLGNFWFSTAIDPIEEAENDKHCFVYGYKHAGAGKLVEVLKTRVERSETANQKPDPDYWEPSRGLVKYGMERFVPTKGNTSKTRWDPIKKNVLYLDFRQSLSAFDKFFYRTEHPAPAELRIRKKTIRERSVQLKKAIAAGTPEYKWYGNRIVDEKNLSFNPTEISHVSSMLGRRYSDIKWLKHTFFGMEACTCVLSASGLNYTEAFAGSGEFAAARLVVEISRAPKGSLILLDEPEVSLHPGAQEALVAFLLDQCKTNRHQFVLSTHSPTIVRNLPNEAIKAFLYDAAVGKIRLPTQTAAPEEAFFYIGEPIPEFLTIIVEDALAVQFIKKALRIRGEALLRRFEIKFFPGGAETLWKHYVPIFSEENRKDILILLDGDKRPATPLADPSTVPESEQPGAIKKMVRDASGADIRFLTDSSGSGADAVARSAAAQDAARLRFASWAYKYVRYLPGASNPEAYIWENMAHNDRSKAIAIHVPPKERFVELTRLDMGLEYYENVNSADILQTQIRALSTVSSDAEEFGLVIQSIDEFLNRPR